MISSARKSFARGSHGPEESYYCFDLFLAAGNGGVLGRKRGVGFASRGDRPPAIASGNNRIEKGKREAKKRRGWGRAFCTVLTLWHGQRRFFPWQRGRFGSPFAPFASIILSPVQSGYFRFQSIPSSVDVLATGVGPELTSELHTLCYVRDKSGDLDSHPASGENLRR